MQLADLVHGQQRTLAAISGQHATLQDDFAALRDCLHEAKIVSTEAFLAKKHRRHFAGVRARYPCSWLGSLENVVETRERIFALAELVGRRSMSTLATCSRSIGRAVHWAGPELAATLPPSVYVVGGEDDDGDALAHVERFDPRSGVWERAPPLPAARKWCAAAGLAGQVYVLGGWGADDDTLDAVDRFDPWSGTWEAMPPMLRRRGAVAAASLAGAVVAVGGQDGELTHRTAEVLDVAQGAWALLPELRRARHAAGAVQLGGAVYAIGGYGARGEVLGCVESYDAQRGLWVERPPLRTPRAGLAAATVGGCAYALGGRDAAGRELCSLERLRPDSSAWEALAPLAVSRWGLGAAACQRKLYALGGLHSAEDASVGACERFCPGPGAAKGSATPRGGAESWAFVGCLQLPRRLFGAASSR